MALLGLTVDAILLTHGHFDHIGAVKPLVRTLQCPVYIHPKEATLPPYLTQGLLWFNEEYAEGDVVQDDMHGRG